ncbi:MAG TPA: immunoglobulin domain-containing protein, partial [Opitutaceae bacterium]
MLRLLFSVLWAAALCAPVLAQTAPTIASLSNSQTVTEGRAVTLTVSVNGTAPFTYQWKKGGANITNATLSTLVLDPVRRTDDGSYTVTVTNSAGSVTSSPVTLAVTAATAPSGVYIYNYSYSTLYFGQTLTLSSAHSGSDPYTYQWKKDGIVIPGATTNSYSKANAQAADAGSYTVTVTNIAGSSTSSAYAVTLQ